MIHITYKICVNVLFILLVRLLITAGYQIFRFIHRFPTVWRSASLTCTVQGSHALVIHNFIIVVDFQSHCIQKRQVSLLSLIILISYLYVVYLENIPCTIGKATCSSDLVFCEILLVCSVVQFYLFSVLIFFLGYLFSRVYSVKVSYY